MGRQIKKPLLICVLVSVSATFLITLWRSTNGKDIRNTEYGEKIREAQLPRLDIVNYMPKTKAGITWAEKRTTPDSFIHRYSLGINLMDAKHIAVSSLMEGKERVATQGIPKTFHTLFPHGTPHQSSVGLSTRNSLNRLRDRFPRIMIIGVGKAPTKLLFDILKTRPDLVGLDLERRFFTKNYFKNITLYLRSFPRPPFNGFVIEKSPDYIYNVLVPKRIKSFAKALNIGLQELKFVVVLKDPIERALDEYMNWDMKRQRKSKTPLKPFHKIVVASNGAISEGQPFVKKSYYVTYVKHWFNAFGSSKTCFVDGNILTSNPYSEFRLLETCLELKPLFNKSSFFFDKNSNYCYQADKNSICMEHLQTVHPDVPPSVNTKLKEYFQVMSSSLSQFCNRSFSWNTF